MTGNRGPGRRGLLKGLGLAGGAAAGALAGSGVLAKEIEPHRTPRSAMAVPTAGPFRPVRGHVDVLFSVNTADKAIALTFDDGPMPRWTPMVLDVLDELKVPATFFAVGERLVENASLVHGRMSRHEIGSHTWSHADLSKLPYDRVMPQLRRAHEAIHAVTGQEARHLRPPYGQLGGTTLSAAAEMGYDLVLWSIKMLEKTYEDEPRRLVEYITNETLPGTIVLAHDTGNPDRLVALDNLRPMVANLRAKGFEFVTVSQLREAGRGA